MIDLLPGIQSASAAMNAERIRMDVISQNIANANTVRGLDGKPYQRQQVVFETVLQGQNTLGAVPGSEAQSVQVARIEKDPRPPRMIYDPAKNAMVAVPDINIHEEMVDLLVASRAYEANLAIVKNSRAMALQALSIGKR